MAAGAFERAKNHGCDGPFKVLRMIAWTNCCRLSDEMESHEPTMSAKAALDAALARQMNQGDNSDVSSEGPDMTSAAMTTVITTVLQ